MVAIAPAACDSGPKTPVGNYTLATVDGKSTPFSVASGVDYQLEIISGALELSAANTFRWVTGVRETVQSYASVYMDTVDGTWTQDGGALRLIAAVDSSTVAATWRRASVTLVLVDGTETMTLVYAK